jgi:hypothetical protein
VSMKLYKTEYFIRASHGNHHPHYARKWRRRWDFYEGESNITTFRDRSEAVRVFRYLQKTQGAHYARLELVQTEVIHRTTVILPPPEVVAALAQLDTDYAPSAPKP